MNHYQHHVFFCLNVRDDGDRCCTDNGAEAMFDYMKASIKKRKLSGKGRVRINRAGCFDRCAEGPIMVVYPEAIWYTFVDSEDIDEIIESHIMQGKPVTRLMI